MAFLTLVRKDGEFMSVKRIVVVMVFVAALAGCSKPKVVPNGAISVNGEWILKNELASVEAAMQNDPQNSPSALFGSDGSMLKKMIAQQVVGQKLLLAEAHSRGIKPDTTMVAKNLESIEKRFPDKATFERELTAAGQSRETLKKQIMEGVMLDSLMKSILISKDSIPEAEVKSYYDENKAKFVSPPKFRLSLIMISVPAKATESAKSLARKKADDAYAQCKAGKNFADIAKKFSDGPGADAGGDIGWFENGSMNPIFDKPASGLKTGDISEVVQAEPGFIILKRTEEKAADPASYEKVRMQITMSLQMKKRAELVSAHVNEIYAKSKVVYADTSYKPTTEMLAKLKAK